MQRAAREDVCISSTGLGLMVITDLAFLLPAALKYNVIKHGVVRSRGQSAFPARNAMVGLAVPAVQLVFWGSGTARDPQRCP